MIEGPKVKTIVQDIYERSEERTRIFNSIVPTNELREMTPTSLQSYLKTNHQMEVSYEQAADYLIIWHRQL